MQTVRGERLAKRMRLRTRSEFLRVQNADRKVHSNAFLGLIAFRDADCPRIGITTSKKIGNAVKRNRVRRLVREAFRRGWMSLPAGMDVVVIAKKRSTWLESRAIYADLETLGRKIAELKDA